MSEGSREGEERSKGPKFAIILKLPPHIITFFLSQELVEEIDGLLNDIDGVGYVHGKFYLMARYSHKQIIWSTSKN